MNARRLVTLIGKELRELRASPSALLPVVVLLVLCVALPIVLLIVVPSVTGESLTSDRTIREVVATASQHQRELAALPAELAIQAFLFQQFLFLFQIAPIVGAVSLAAYSVVGEKQGRTLEPLLTTPVTTAEILLAKVLGAFMPSIAMELAGLGAYVALVGTLAGPAVLGALVSSRSAVLIGLIGPIASLVALQITIAISSRVNDPRSAQQLAVLFVLPLVMMIVGQIAGAFFIATSALIVIATVLAVVWGLLVLFSVALFERETILTRWK
jgi:ABC-2 type transport system permease protein